MGKTAKISLFTLISFLMTPVSLFAKLGGGWKYEYYTSNSILGRWGIYGDNDITFIWLGWYRFSIPCSPPVTGFILISFLFLLTLLFIKLNYRKNDSTEK